MPTSRSRGGCGAQATALLVALAASLVACHTEGVLPPGLRDRGSLGSTEYAAAELYPASGATLEILRPRLGSPALLAPAADSLAVDLWLAQPGDATGLLLTALDGAGGAFALSAEAAPACDGIGRCALTVTLPADLPTGQPLQLCVSAPGAARCEPGALFRYAEEPAPLRVAQITDLHLRDTAKGGERAARLRHLLQAIASHRPAIHLVVATGDLTDDGQAGSFPRVADALATSPLPVLTVPGNHDFKDGGVDDYLRTLTPELDHSHRLGPYLLVAMSSGPGRWEQERRGWNGQSAGLEAAQIAWLEALLAEAPAAALIFVHNPPFSVFGMVIGKRRRALVRIARAGGVSAILAGHTHHQEVFDHAGVSQGLPVGCAAEAPQGRQPITLVTPPALDRLNGGFRLAELHPDGRLGYCYVSVGWP